MLRTTFIKKLTFLVAATILVCSLPQQCLGMIVDKPAVSGIITSEGKPSPALLTLCDKLGVKHDGSLKNICDETQKVWLRKEHLERVHIKPWAQVPYQELKPLFEELGVLHEVRPSQKKYTFGVIMGSYLWNMAERLDYLFKQVEEGIEVEQVVFLVGDRDASPEEDSAKKMKEWAPQYAWLHVPFEGENLEKLMQDFKNETQLAKFLWVFARKPAKLNGVSVTFIDTPKTKDGKRPTTATTVAKFIRDFKLFERKDDQILMVTTQPFVEYMHRNFEAETKGKLKAEFIGPKVSQKQLARENSVEILLDNITRTLYAATH